METGDDVNPGCSEGVYVGTCVQRPQLQRSRWMMHPRNDCPPSIRFAAFPIRFRIG